jgi:hypothetical protein
MLTFKNWLENTVMGQIQMVPNMGNADEKRGDLNSKYFARDRSYAELPPGDEVPQKITHERNPEDQYGFDHKDKFRLRKTPRQIDKGRTFPSRTTQVYT